MKTCIVTLPFSDLEREYLLSLTMQPWVKSAINVICSFRTPIFRLGIIDYTC